MNPSAIVWRALNDRLLIFLSLEMNNLYVYEACVFLCPANLELFHICTFCPSVDLHYNAVPFHSIRYERPYGI